jgi:enolase
VNVAVTASVPTGASADEHEAVKFESGAEHRFATGAVPVVNTTVPVGVPPPGTVTATAAV